MAGKQNKPRRGFHERVENLLSYAYCQPQYDPREWSIFSGKIEVNYTEQPQELRMKIQPHDRERARTLAQHEMGHYVWTQTGSGQK